jgi:hypothetical protein
MSDGRNSGKPHIDHGTLNSRFPRKRDAADPAAVARCPSQGDAGLKTSRQPRRCWRDGWRRRAWCNGATLRRARLSCPTTAFGGLSVPSSKPAGPWGAACALVASQARTVAGGASLLGRPPLGRGKGRKRAGRPPAGQAGVERRDDHVANSHPGGRFPAVGDRGRLDWLGLTPVSFLHLFCKTLKNMGEIYVTAGLAS